MNICIDTCAYTTMRQGDASITRAIEDADSVFVPVIVLGELYAGFLKGSQTQRNTEDLERFLGLPEVIVQDTDREVALRYGLVMRDLRKQGTPIPTSDVWIAATALATGSRLLTLDAHFGRVPGLATIGLQRN